MVVIGGSSLHAGIVGNPFQCGAVFSISVVSPCSGDPVLRLLASISQNGCNVAALWRMPSCHLWHGISGWCDDMS